MSVAYVVLAHHKPEQLVRLLRRLQSPHATYVVHYDARSDDASYETVRDAFAGCAPVGFLDRQPCRWGGWSLVAVVLRALADLVRRDVPFEHAVFLSGQDYPLAPAGDIETFLAQRRGTSFMSREPLPWDAWGARGGLDRIENLHVERWHAIRGRTLRIRLPARRRLPDGLRPYGGSAHWCLARNAVEHVVRVVRDRPEVVRFFRRVWIPDEIFFQTILMSSDLAGTVVNETLHYTSWRSGSARPDVLTARDLPALLASGKLFARKFDADVDARVLDLLDAA